MTSGSRDSGRRECEGCGQLIPPGTVWGACPASPDHAHMHSSPLPAEGETEPKCTRCHHLIAHHMGDGFGCYCGCKNPTPPRPDAAPAAAGEVRVEWGVRWWPFEDEPQVTFSTRDAAERERDQLSAEGMTDEPVVVARTTSPWVPVSDDQPKEQNR